MADILSFLCVQEECHFETIATQQPKAPECHKESCYQAMPFDRLSVI
jgi:hypothetical protein